jgi:hypothetical protein
MKTLKAASHRARRDHGEILKEHRLLVMSRSSLLSPWARTNGVSGRDKRLFQLSNLFTKEPDYLQGTLYETKNIPANSFYCNRNTSIFQGIAAIGEE